MEIEKSSRGRRLKVLDMSYIALGAVVMSVCSWIVVPAAVPFTMQTFAVFAVTGMLGGKRGTISILIYMLMGAIGIPVFSGATGGVGILMGSTGGYIIGFLGSALVMWAMEKFLGKKLIAQVVSMVTGLAVCYAFGTVWFMNVYAKSNGAVGLVTVLGWCVIPFIIPDIIKIALAVVISRRVGKYVQ